MQPQPPPEPPADSSWVNFGPPMPPKRRHTVRNILLIVGGLLLVAIVTTATLAGTDNSKSSSATTAPRFTPTEPYGPAEQTTSVYSPPVPKYIVPTKRDFRITLKVTKQDCFGEAGCNVTYEPKLEQLSLGDFDPSVTYDVTYEVRGSDDGAHIDTLQVTGTKYESSEGFAGTANENAKLTAVITSVEAE